MPVPSDVTTWWMQGETMEERERFMEEGKVLFKKIVL